MAISLLGTTVAAAETTRICQGNSICTNLNEYKFFELILHLNLFFLSCWYLKFYTGDVDLANLNVGDVQDCVKIEGDMTLNFAGMDYFDFKKLLPNLQGACTPTSKLHLNLFCKFDCFVLHSKSKLNNTNYSSK
jgi:hypothetical protein